MSLRVSPGSWLRAAALDSGKISFTLSGSVAPKVAEGLRASSRVAVHGELGESQTLEGFLRR